MKRLSGLMLGVLAWLFALPAGAKTASQVFQLNSPRVVVVLTYAAGKVVELGSGVKLPNGSVATNCHVLKEGTVFRVRYRGVLYAARMDKSDWDRDVCSLDVPGLPAPPVVLGSTRTLQVGAEVYAIGTPEGLQRTLTEGIVSGLRPVGGSYIQTTAAISPGSSGGGLFDDQGRLLGLTSFYMSEGQQLNFALPVEWIEALPLHSTARAASGTSEVQWITQAAALENHKDWQGLQALAKRWIKAQPRTAGGWLELGEADYSLGQYAQAINAYRQGMQINPQYYTAWNNLGLSYDHAGQHAQAVDAFRQALQINPQDARAWSNLGLSYDGAGQHAQAIDAFRQALQINPQDADAWNNLGVAYVAAGQYAQAIDDYRQALQINPQEAQAWNNLGMAYGELGQKSQAIAAFRQALQINPQYAKAWTRLAVTYAALGQYAQAIDAYRQGLQISPQDAQAWFGLGLCDVLSGQRQNALAVYQRLKTLDPSLAQKLFDDIVPK